MSCIDHIFIKMKSSIEAVPMHPFIFRYDLTDHYPVMVNLHLEASDTKSMNDDSYLKKYIDYVNLRKQLREIHWEMIYGGDNVSDATIQFVNTIRQAIEDNTKVVRVRKHKKHRGSQMLCWCL